MGVRYVSKILTQIYLSIITAGSCNVICSDGLLCRCGGYVCRPTVPTRPAPCQARCIAHRTTFLHHLLNSCLQPLNCHFTELVLCWPGVCCRSLESVDQLVKQLEPEMTRKAAQSDFLQKKARSYRATVKQLTVNTDR